MAFSSPLPAAASPTPATPAAPGRPSLASARRFPVCTLDGATAQIVFDESGITFFFELPACAQAGPDGIITLSLHDPRCPAPSLWQIHTGADGCVTGLGEPGEPVLHREAAPDCHRIGCTLPWRAFSADGRRPATLRWSAGWSGAGQTASQPAPAEWHALDFDGSGGRSPHLWVNTRHVVVGEAGLLPRRVSTTLLDALTEGEQAVARMTAGIELQVHAPQARLVRARFRVVHDDGFPVSWALFVANRKRHPTRVVAEGGRQVQEISWTLAPERGTPQPIRLLFPLHAEIELIALEVESGEPILPPAAPMRAGRIRWMAHGDSITHGANVTSPEFTWLEQAARQLGLAPFNLGFGGNARAQESMAQEIAAANDWDLLTLHLGVNSMEIPPEVYRAQYDRFLEIIRAAHPHKPIVCVTPLIHFTDFPEETPPHLRKLDIRAERNREAIRAVFAARAGSDPHLFLIEGREILDDLDQLLNDGTHPADYGAATIARNLAERLAPLVAGMKPA